MSQAHTNETAGEEVVVARLWQDPLEAIQAHWTSILSHMNKHGEIPARVTLPGTIKDLAAQQSNGPHLRLLVMLSGKPYADDIEQRRRQRYAIVAALTDHGYSPKDADRLGYVIGPRFPRTDGKRVCGKANTVTSASGIQTAAKCTLLVGFERYEPQNEPQNSDRPRWRLVTVLWLNAQDFEPYPLQQVGALMAALPEHSDTRPDQRGNSSTTSVLLGPPTSGQLARMDVDDRQKCATSIASQFLARVDQYPSTRILLSWGEEWWPRAQKTCYYNELQSELANLHILSTRSTVPLDILFRSGDESNYPNDEPPMTDTVAEKLLGVASFRSVVARDDRVLRQILEELQGRGACQSPGTTLLSIVHEQDTKYGRLFPKIVKDLANEPQFFKKCLFGIKEYGYLTGVDGESPLDRKGAGELLAQQRSGEGLGPFASWFPRQERVEPAVGDAQLDYLRRLAGEIERARDEEGYDHVAIGVFGADVYDKQLILQAVRARLPEAAYFTTDLDVRFDDPDARRWTRNLIIGSAYDLSIGGQKVPPFRDSYQTATYRAAALTLASTPPLSQSAKFLQCGHEGSGDGCAPSPMTFEMGLRGPIELGSCTGSCKDTVHLSDKAGRVSWASKIQHYVPRLLPLAPLLVLMSVAAHMVGGRLNRDDSKFRYRAYRFVLVVTVVATVLAIILMCYGSKPEYEPREYLRGVSSVPAMVLDATIVAFALSMVRILFGRFAQADQNVVKEFALPEVKDVRGLGFGQWKVEALLRDDRREDRTIGSIWREYVARRSAQRWGPWVAIRATVGGIGAFLVVRLAPDELVTKGLYILAEVLEVAMLLAVVGSICYWSYFVSLERWLVRNVGRNSVEDIDESRELTDQKSRAMDFVVERTRTAAPILVMPFLLFPLLMLARSTVFEGWAWSWHWLLMFGALAGYVLNHTIAYQREAIEAKNHILDKLNRHRLVVANDIVDLRRLDAVIEHVGSTRDGAFSPWMRHPILQSLALPAAGLGLIGLLDFLFGR